MVVKKRVYRLCIISLYCLFGIFSCKRNSGFQGTTDIAMEFEWEETTVTGMWNLFEYKHLQAATQKNQNVRILDLLLSREHIKSV